ncbi:MAG: chemotaxis protein CheB [Nitrospinae bacterium]|nr:chemotaxis protein CheB [Nitrospinota bacterium]
MVIGVSTGGPDALMHVIPQIPPTLPVPVAVVQHIIPGYLHMLCNRLSLERVKVWGPTAASSVELAQNRGGLLPGKVYFGPDGSHLRFRNGKAWLTDRPTDHLHCPAVDVLFASAAENYGAGTLGVVMTGMGADGSRGGMRVKKAGGVLLAQDEATSQVYGMPKVVVDLHLADMVVPLEHIAPTIMRIVKARNGG